MTFLSPKSIASTFPLDSRVVPPNTNKGTITRSVSRVLVKLVHPSLDYYRITSPEVSSQLRRTILRVSSDRCRLSPSILAVRHASIHRLERKLRPLKRVLDSRTTSTCVLTIAIWACASVVLARLAGRTRTDRLHPLLHGRITHMK